MSRTLSLLIITSALLASCGVTPSPQPGQTDPPISQSAGSTKLLTVTPRPGQTAQDLARQYPGATLKLWRPAQGEQPGIALLRLPSQTDHPGVRGLSVNTEQPEDQVYSSERLQTSGKIRLNHVKPAGSTVWMEGSTVWMEGSTVWMEGSTVWMEGSTVWMEGSTVWMEGQGPLRMKRHSDGSVRDNLSAWNDTGILSLHARGLKGQGQTIAIIDGGMDLSHPVLRNMAVRGAHDYVDGDEQPTEGHASGAGYGHGTGVAGLVAQLAPQATLMPMRVLDENGNGDTDVVAQAIVDASDAGATVINLSLSTHEASPAIEAAVRYASSRGAQVLAATGNEGVAAGLPADLGRQLSGVYAVGSYLERTPLSPQPWSNGGMDVELLGPGQDLLTAAPGNQIAFWSGTSMTTAVASAAAALEAQQNQTLSGDTNSGAAQAQALHAD